MQVKEIYVLIDETTHNTTKAAKEHCLEEMGAAIRTLLVETYDKRLPMQALDIVEHKKYDKDIMEYVKWRKEHDSIEEYENALTQGELDAWHGRADY